MRSVCAVVLTACVWLLGASGLEAKIVCGRFDGSFSCKTVPGVIEHGKNATPGARVGTPEDGLDDTTGGQDGTGAMPAEPLPPESPAAAEGTCQHGMVGTPPNCRCPKNSELLGGNCVHYTASACSSGLAADAPPQACRGVEEKLSCTLRQDGLKDCCCVTYDKF